MKSGVKKVCYIIWSTRENFLFLMNFTSSHLAGHWAQNTPAVQLSNTYFYCTAYNFKTNFSANTMMPNAVIASGHTASTWVLHAPATSSIRTAVRAFQRQNIWDIELYSCTFWSLPRLLSISVLAPRGCVRNLLSCWGYSFLDTV